MSLDALPYMAFLVLVEFTVGGMLVTYGTHLRGLVTRGFLKMAGASVLASGCLAAWVGLTIGGQRDVGGYPLDDSFVNPTRVALWLLLAALAAYTASVWREAEPAGRLSGAASATAGIVVLSLTAAVFRDPAWGYAGVLLSLLTGALSLGAVTMGMILGHWYLVTPRLPEQPLNELTLTLIAILVVQTVLLLINLAIPVRLAPSAEGAGLAQSPAFWLRIGVGLLFPIALASMAWRSSLIRGMMSATGLLYVATGAVLAGEALARGLQFSTAIPF